MFVQINRVQNSILCSLRFQRALIDVETVHLKSARKIRARGHVFHQRRNIAPALDPAQREVRTEIAVLRGESHLCACGFDHALQVQQMVCLAVDPAPDHPRTFGIRETPEAEKPEMKTAFGSCALAEQCAKVLNDRGIRFSQKFQGQVDVDWFYRFQPISTVV